MTALTTEHVTVTLRDWLEQNVEGWRNVEVKPLNVALGSGFSAEIFFVDVAYADDRGRQEQSLVVRRQPTDFEVVLGRSEEHTSELQSLMRISYAVFCLKKKKIQREYTNIV